MRWPLLGLILCTSAACSPEQKAKEEVKIEVHAQPVVNKITFPKEELPPDAQSFHDGMVALCQSYEKVEKVDDPAESQKLLHAWLAENVTNKKVREVFTLVGKMPPSQRSGMLRAAAAKVGITDCPLAGPDPLKTVSPTEM